MDDAHAKLIAYQICRSLHAPALEYMVKKNYVGKSHTGTFETAHLPRFARTGTARARMMVETSENAAPNDDQGLHG